MLNILKGKNVINIIAFIIIVFNYEDFSYLLSSLYLLLKPVKHVLPNLKLAIFEFKAQI